MTRSSFALGRLAGLLLVLLGLVVALPTAVRAQEEPQGPVLDLLVSTHMRLSFDKDIRRVAVADEEIIQSEVLTDREVLLLGRRPGRTTVMIWFQDGTTGFYMFQVRRDLALLEEALKEIHPSISVQAAPDRDAVVLRGLVPDVSYSNAAEEAAQRYLDARRTRRGVAPAAVAAPPEGTPPAGPGGVPAGNVEPVEYTGSTSMVINLIRVESLPGRLEERMEEAIGKIGANRVRVRRLVRGRLPDDTVDIFVLEGSVATQTQLVRSLSIAQSLIGEGGQSDIQVRADESGALTDSSVTGGANQSFTGSRSLSGIFGGSSASRQLQNLVESNLGRAKVIEAAKGRILSFLEVTDLPQVRVDIRLYEVNSSRLRDFSSNFGVLVSNFTQPSLNPGLVATAAQGRGNAARVGAQGENPDVQNVLGFLAGTLSNQFQLAGDNFAIDSVLSLLESKGWARSLSRPSLTVLSGERAYFQVGGEIPIPESFATTSVAVSEGVYNSVFFRPFGVQLAVRPLVGDDGAVTMDVVPEISLPDAQLTDAIRQATDTAQTTTAFRTRYLSTTARLDDGEALMLGGLLSRNMQANDESTPGLSDLPLVGGLFSNNARQGDEIQLVVVVHPVLERSPTNRARMWAFPAVHELMSGVRAPDGLGRACR